MGASMLKEKVESEEEIKEVFITKLERQVERYCSECNIWDILKKEATCICFVCKSYLCLKCMNGHKHHTCFNGMSEGSERERQIDGYLRYMKNESNREELFYKEEVCIIGRVKANHHLDERYCSITGLCGMENSGLVVCDNENSCIKLTSRRTNVFHRYIRFMSKPFDVIEINVKQKSTHMDPTPVSSKTNITVTNRYEPKTQSLLAVTLPTLQEIWFVDVSQMPSIKTKSIKLQKQCWSINFCEDQIFTLCSSKSRNHSSWFLYVLSSDGDTIHAISTDIPYSRTDVPRIVVSPGKVYLADTANGKVICLNNEGTVICQTKTDQLKGISVDIYNNNNVNLYVKDRYLYQLNSSLDGCESVIDMSPVYFSNKTTLCLYRGKLYVSSSDRAGDLLIARVL